MASTSFFAYPLNPVYAAKYTTFPVYPTCKCCQPVQAYLWAPPHPSLKPLPKLPDYFDDQLDDDDTPTLYERSRSNSCDSLASFATLASQPPSPDLTVRNDLNAEDEYTLATFFEHAAVYKRTFRERWWSAGPPPYTSPRILHHTVYPMAQPDLSYYGTYSRAWAHQYYRSYPYAQTHEEDVNRHKFFERMAEVLTGGSREEEYWRKRSDEALNGRDESFLL
ncbi:hypothetical protein HDU97_001305 [Phlyctochytrium planicorne]|nr:hypothetical protein HDU97_001305 [Phlyctochytrium planicorne]